MNDEHGLGTKLGEGLKRLPLPGDDMVDVARRARRLRVRRIAVAGAVALVAAAGITLPLLLLLPLGGTNADHPRPASSASAWMEHDDARDQVSIQTPPDWFFNDDPVPALLDPRVLFAASTAPIQSGGECAPDNATGNLPADGALLWVVEYTSVGTGTEGPQRAPYEFPPRDGSFQLGPLQGPFECIGVRTHLVLFRDGGRYFQVHVMLGPDASSALEADVLRSLDSFQAQSTGGPSPSDLCATGPWTYCPEAAWLYGAATDAGFVANGDTGSALVFAGRGAEFYLWSTHEQEVDNSYRPVNTVDGVDVLSDGTRLTWLTQGARVWVEPGPHVDSQSPSGQALADLVQATVDSPLVNG
jgi:hypothetical protein